MFLLQFAFGDRIPNCNRLERNKAVSTPSVRIRQRRSVISEEVGTAGSR